MEQWDRVPAPLPELQQWVLWQTEARGERVAKMPIDPATGRRLKNWRHSDQHLTFADAVALQNRGVGDGIGFVCTGRDGLVWLDIDEALGAEGKLAEAVYQMQLQLDAPAELSLSGRGYHIPVFAPKVAESIKASGKGKLVLSGERYGFGKLEIFVSSGFIALTGRFLILPQRTVPDRDQALDEVLRKAWPQRWPLPAKPDVRKTTAPGATKPAPAAALTEQDRVMLQLMMHQTDSGKFRRLFGKPNEQPFPETDYRSRQYVSRSETDLALARKIVFYCCGRKGGGIDQARRIMLASQLRRDKWYERRNGSTYLDQTLAHAVDQQRESGGFWDGKKQKREYHRTQRFVPPVPPMPEEQLEKKTLHDNVLRGLGLSPAVRATYKALRRHNRGKSYCFPSQEKLAADLGVSVRTIRNHLRNLVRTGLILLDRLQRPNGKRGRGRMYWFVKPEILSGGLPKQTPANPAARAGSTDTGPNLVSTLY